MIIEGILEIMQTDYEGCVQTEYVAIDGNNLANIIEKVDARKVKITIELIED